MYTDLATLIARADFGIRTLIELSDVAEPPTGAVNEGVVNAAIAAAQAEIDAYLPVAWLPIAPTATPLELTRLATDITLYRLSGSRYSEATRVAYEDALKKLKLIQAGKLSLGLTVGGVAAQAATPQVAWQVGANSFDRAALRDYVGHP